MRDEQYGAGVSPEIFRKILKERKAEIREKAKLKRLHDLQRIQDMKSTEGKTAVELLPEELWESMIMDDLGPDDRRNLWQLDPLFRSLMETTHTQENLFPLVLKFQVHLFQKVTLEKDDVTDAIPNATDDDDEEPLDRPFLQLRRVCKSWRNAVDRVIEEDLLKVLRKGKVDSVPKKILKFQFYCTRAIPDPGVENLDRILSSEFLQCFFIPRSLLIDFTFLTFDQDFMEIFAQLKGKIVQLLKHAGSNLLHFGVKIAQVDDSLDDRLTEIYLALVQWLSFMPNLKWLQLRFSCWEKRLGAPLDLQVLRNQPPPEIKSLERLELTVERLAPCQRGEMEAIFQAILSACPQITKVNLVTPGVYDVLSRSRSSHSEIFSLGSSATGLLDLSPIAFTLQRLTLHLDLNHDVHNMSSVFQFLQQFPSLEKVKLDIDNVIIDDALDFLQLPKLEDFDLRFHPKFNRSAPFQFFFSLQFLLHCKNLRKLAWKNRLQIEGVEKLLPHLGWQEGPESMIDFVDGRRSLLESNVWRVFPYLKEVLIVIIVPFGEGGHSVTVREYRDRNLVDLFDMATDKDGNPV